MKAMAQPQREELILAMTRVLASTKVCASQQSDGAEAGNARLTVKAFD
jgi:hypothetical protein